MLTENQRRDSIFSSNDEIQPYGKKVETFESFTLKLMVRNAFNINLNQLLMNIRL